jgi:hypothetical protein
LKLADLEKNGEVVSSFCDEKNVSAIKSILNGK